MQQGRGVDEFHRRGELDMIASLIATNPRRRERQHRAQPLAAGLDQMRRHLGDARGMFRDHSFTDQGIHRSHFIGQKFGQAVLRFGIGGDVHHSPATRLDKGPSLLLHPTL